MSDAKVVRPIDVTDAMRRVQTAVEEGRRELRDPRQIYVSVAYDMTFIDGEMLSIRVFNPVLGQLWDLLKGVYGLACDIHDQLESIRGGQGGERVRPAVPADNGDSSLSG